MGQTRQNRLARQIVGLVQAHAHETDKCIQVVEEMVFNYGIRIENRVKAANRR